MDAIFNALFVTTMFRICYGFSDIATHDYDEATFKFGLAFSFIIFAADVVIGLINLQKAKRTLPFAWVHINML